MMLDFDKIDQKKVAILCRHPETIQPLIDFLKLKQFDIRTEKLPGEFFQAVAQMQPGFVMISHEINQTMGDFFPQFIHKKFKIPVMMFHELQGKSAVIGAPTPPAQPEILSLASDSPEQVLASLEGFQKNYDKSLLKFSRTGPAPSQEQLREARIVRQEQILRRLSQKLRAKQSPLTGKAPIDLVSIKVVDPSGQGCFFFCTEITAETNIAELQEQLREDLTVSGDQRLQIEPMDVQIEMDIFRKLQLNSDQAVHGFWGDQPVSVLYYIDGDLQNQDGISVIEGGYLVPVEEWWSQVPLTFNAHIWLDSNHKKILFVRRGKALPQETNERLRQAQKKLLILGEDFSRFQQLAEIVSLAFRPLDLRAS